MVILKRILLVDCYVPKDYSNRLVFGKAEDFTADLRAIWSVDVYVQ